MLVAATAVPAFARPTVIAELGTAPLLGTSTSTAQMRARVAGNAAFVEQAARKIGLSASEYANFSSAIATSRVAWVTVPRRLDAMTWRSGSHVYVLRNVIIPAGTHGWEVDLHSGDQRIAVYMPAACGNVSVVRSAWRAVAQRPQPPALAPKVVAYTAMPQAVVAPEPVAVIPDDTPVLTPAAVAQSAFPPAVAARHSALPFLAPLLFGLAALSGGGSSGSIVPVPATCP